MRLFDKMKKDARYAAAAGGLATLILVVLLRFARQACLVLSSILKSIGFVNLFGIVFSGTAVFLFAVVWKKYRTLAISEPGAATTSQGAKRGILYILLSFGVASLASPCWYMFSINAGLVTTPRQHELQKHKAYSESAVERLKTQSAEDNKKTALLFKVVAVWPSSAANFDGELKNDDAFFNDNSIWINAVEQSVPTPDSDARTAVEVLIVTPKHRMKMFFAPALIGFKHGSDKVTDPQNARRALMAFFGGVAPQGRGALFKKVLIIGQHDPSMNDVKAKEEKDKNVQHQSLADSRAVEIKKLIGTLLEGRALSFGGRDPAEVVVTAGHIHGLLNRSYSRQFYKPRDLTRQNMDDQQDFYTTLTKSLGIEDTELEYLSKTDEKSVKEQIRLDNQFKLIEKELLKDGLDPKELELVRNQFNGKGNPHRFYRYWEGSVYCRGFKGCSEGEGRRGEELEKWDRRLKDEFAPFRSVLIIGLLD